MEYGISRIAHVNIRIPEGTEAQAENFWCDMLGFTNLPKPAGNAHPGRWFAGGDFEVHVSPDADFVPVTRAHTAFVVEGLTGLANQLQNSGIKVHLARGTADDVESCFVEDPFGNRLEFMTPHAASVPA